MYLQLFFITRESNYIIMITTEKTLYLPKTMSNFQVNNNEFGKVNIFEKM